MEPTKKVATIDCQQKSVDEPMQGDGQVFEELLSRYSSLLYRTALRQLHNPEDAEDAVQDALLSAWKHVSQFEGRSQISTWLTRIVINSARMHLRRRPRTEHISFEQVQGDQNLLFGDQFVDTSPSPEEICENAELHEILNELLQQLSPLRRAAFRLYEIEGFSMSEAARILGATETVLKAQLFRARAQLCILFQLALGSHPPPRTRTTEEAHAESPPNHICGHL